MATSRKRGKVIFVLIVYFLVSTLFGFSSFVRASEVVSSPNSKTAIETDNENGEELKEKDIECDRKSPNYALLKEQQRQLEKLEELVLNLTQLVARLQPQFNDAPSKVTKLHISSSHDEIRDTEKVMEEDRSGRIENDHPDEGSAESVLVTKFNTFWSDRFQFVSAVKLSSNPTCVNVFPFRDFDGLNRYFSVGDDKGRLYVFFRTGDVAMEFDLFLDGEESSPVTAMVSYLSIYKNESTIVTGHENGVVIMLRVWEVLSGEEWSSLHVERVGRFDTQESGRSRINLLDVHYVGRKRYILVINGGGDIIVFREDGSIHGTVTPSRRPIAFLKQRLLFLTDTGAGSLDLRNMKLKESECEGLNGSFAMNYVFDAMERTKAYGFTSDGDFIHTVLLGDMTNFKCRVRSKKKLDLDEPVALQAIRGYLLIANREKVFVYNISSHHYVRVGGIRLLFSVHLDDIIASFLNHAVIDNDKRMSTPLITGDYEKKHIIISLGNGFVAMYRSNLPVFKSEFNSILWTSPVLFFIIFLFVIWNFYTNKKVALTSWDPDDPFNSASVTSGAPSVSNNGDRSSADSSRNSEIMDLRATGLRSSSRYGSPTRFPGGTGNAYRTGPPEQDPRPFSVDSRYRPNSELTYRGPNPEAAGVPKRRDMMFADDGS